MPDRSNVRCFAELLGGGLLGYVTVSLAESLLHAGVQHTSVRTRKRLRRAPALGGAISQAHMSHAVVHHRLTYRQDHVTQFTGDQEEARVRGWIVRHARNSDRIIRDKYGLSLAVPDGIASFVLPVLPVFALYLLRASRPLAVGLAVPLAVYPLSSAELHPYLHMSKQEIEQRASRPMRRLLSTRVVRYIARHHYVHHRDEQYNFNLLPFGDWVLGRSRRPTAGELADMRRIGMLV